MSTSLRRVSGKFQRGFTLMEVLIAALVLAIGLLGLSGLQAVSQKLNYSAYQRSQAASLVYEIADAIRANSKNASEYGDGTTISITSDDCDSTLSRINKSTVAASDLSEWANRIACTFPGGSEYTIDSSGSNSVSIEIDWADSEKRVRAVSPGEDEPTELAENDTSGEGLRDELMITIQL